MKKLVHIALILTLLIITACDKREPAKITSMNDLKVAEDFTFSTVKPVHLNLSSIDAQSNPIPLAPFRLYRSGDKNVVVAKTNSEGIFDFNITVPSYENKLYLETDSALKVLSIPSDGELAATFVGTSSKAKSTFSYFTPSEGNYATLAYEDLWPQNGDYDINDLVLDINVEEVYDDETWELSELVFKYKVRAIGARRVIGFATTLPSYIVADAQPTSTNGFASWVSDQNTLVFFNNARDLVSDDPAEFFNTEHTIPHNTDADIVHEITLQVTENWDWKDSTKMVWIPWSSAPFNPFIFINNNQSYQIHLKHYPVIPGYANMALFSTEDDFSDVTNPDYPESYQNHNYCPWAFYIAESTDYPLEKRSILNAFPTFADWA
ncbi:MAG: LruC domain-containing protein, partial [Candidatus Cloacimonetes bacterium]|nr:LruC domain-containing protein [Candidatus Cloacimonadota bacterium]